jgi:hypothetical protein
MILGAWFHNADGNLSFEHLQSASAFGITSIRSYNYSYVAQLASMLKSLKMSVYAGIYIQSEDILSDPGSQIKTDIASQYFDLNIPITALCVGNELRDLWTEVGKWSLSEDLAAKLAEVILELKNWLADRGYDVPITYAMEGPFPWGEWITPVVRACDVISINHYPIKGRHWFGEGGFQENKRFLTAKREQALLMLEYELALRQVMEKVTSMDKELILSEVGIASGVGFRRTGKLFISEHDPQAFEDTYKRLLSIIHKVNEDYDSRIKGVYFYEWRDNLYHGKIQSENSPIHTCFGLCYSDGTPKFDLEFLQRPLPNHKVFLRGKF